ncbi:glycosyltransferase family 2 protein [Chryseobacterium sp. EO14]|uniref:glycosyltransferase family 2 protein n=1 Tax=Chryseobacterium sp. EO14 TaxID=2950551 RepID=UPI00210BC906|nr:glycosyltransferase family 2 protein [Chryseobacterium sp. EO14]MCQ4142690.1 glycosyltransferase family 2 protein [Chryseobacterium sp. EO14]
MTLSLAIITFNEQYNIIKLLDSIADIANEIIIVDSYSTDNTKLVCKRYPNVKFFERKFSGYGEQKNYALSLCNSEWVLFLDADEIPDNDLKGSILNVILSNNSSFNVYKLKLDNYLGNHLLRFGGWGNVYRERFFRRKFAKFSDDIVHEFLITNQKVGTLSGKINHYTYKNIHHHILKINTYSEMMVEKMIENGKSSSKIKIILAPMYEFVKVYFFKLGFLDGFLGFYVAKTISYYTFLKYTKLYEKLRLIR